jgi:hypothetical protein
VQRYYMVHAALPRLTEAVANLGFGRSSTYGIQPAAARHRSSAVPVRTAGVDDFETVARLVLVEIQHRSTPPMFGRPHAPPLADVVAEHRASHKRGRSTFSRPLTGKTSACSPSS